MKENKFKQFKNDVFKQINTYVKKYTLLNSKEIKKIFPPHQAYMVSLYGLLFHPSLKTPPPIPKYLVPLAIIEILIKAELIHRSIDDDDFFFLSPQTFHGEQMVLKNTRKILLGDMLVTTAINAIHSLSEMRMRKEFSLLGKEIFRGNIEKLIPQSSRRTRNRPSWILAMTFLCPAEDRPRWRRFGETIFSLIGDCLQSPDAEWIEKKVLHFEKTLCRWELTTSEREFFLSWLHRELLQASSVNPELNPKNHIQVKKNSIYQLLL